MKTKKQNRALVIVDMQTGFETSYKRQTIEACQSLIRQFKRDKLPIIVLEYSGSFYGHTHQEIAELLEKYPLCYWRKKRIDNGSNKVHTLLKVSHPSIKDIVVCGVNIEACVLATVEGLEAKKYNVTVVRKACNDAIRTWHRFHFGNVKLK